MSRPHTCGGGREGEKEDIPAIEAAECYLSTGELRPLGDLEFPFSMLLDTAMLCEYKWGITEG